jgi:hypothetical protein
VKGYNEPQVNKKGAVMPPTSRASALKLASVAYEVGADSLRGTLQQNAAGRWAIGPIEVETWLARHAGKEIVLAAAPIQEEAPETYRRTCRTCGNEYSGSTCPHCDEVRSRLRRQ